MLKMNKGQIWVETVIYTLIGLSIIAIVLAFVKPEIERMQDKAVIEQSIDLLNNLDKKINDIRTGGSRVEDIRIKRGSLIINGINDSIKFVLDDSRIKYSEPGIEIASGRINILTLAKPDDTNSVELWINYTAFNITYQEEDKVKIFQKASVPYQLGIQNLGRVGEKVQIDFSY